MVFSMNDNPALVESSASEHTSFTVDEASSESFNKNHTFTEFGRPFERALYLVFVTFALLLYVAAPFLQSSDMRWTGGVVVLMLSGWLGLLCLGWLLYRLLDLMAYGRWRTWKLSVGMGLLAAYLILDQMYYNLFRAHINGQALQLAYKSFVETSEIQVGWFGLMGGFGLFVAWILGSALGIFLLGILLRSVKQPASSRLPVLSILAFGLVLTLFRGVLLGESDLHAEALRSLFPWESKKATTSLILPGHGERATSGFQEKKQLRYFSEERERKQLLYLQARRKKRLKKKLQAKQRPNILIISVESLRDDVTNQKYMPQLTTLTRSWLRPRNAYSTGNNTGTGLFGIFSGLWGYYYQLAREYSITPLSIDLLKKLGYKLYTHYSVPMHYDRLQGLFFGKRIDQMLLTKFQKGEGKASFYRQDPFHILDKRMLKRYVKHLKEDRSSRPRMDFMIFYSTHYNYYYPKEFNVFRPTLDLHYKVYAEAPRKSPSEIVAIKNRYLNAVRYVDHLLTRLIRQLRDMGRLKNTIVVIVGDHGEEFWEKGRFGHAYGLNNEQIRVPMLMHFPKPRRIRYSYASHVDIMPTIFDYMGFRFDKDAWMTGKSLFDYDERRDFVISGLGVTGQRKNYKYVVIGSGYKVHLNNFGPPGFTRVTDLEDKDVKSPDLRKVQKLLSVFQKSKSLPSGPGLPGTWKQEFRQKRLLKLPKKDLLQQLLRYERQSKRWSQLPKTLWDPFRSSDSIRPSQLFQHPWKGKVYPALERSLKHFQLEFLSEGWWIGAPNKSWQRWRIHKGQLQVMNALGEVEVSFLFDASGGKLVGKDVNGYTYVLRRAKKNKWTFPKSIWPKERLPNPVHGKILRKHRWYYGLYSKQLRRNENHLLLDFDKKYIKHRGKELFLWRVHQGQLYLFSKNRQFIISLYYDATLTRLMGFDKKGLLHVLCAHRPKASSPLLAAFWQGATKPSAITPEELVEVTWDYNYYSLLKIREGGRKLVFGKDGTFKQGKSYNWFSWSIKKGKLQVHNEKKELLVAFAYNREYRKLVGFASDGFIYVLAAQQK